MKSNVFSPNASVAALTTTLLQQPQTKIGLTHKEKPQIHKEITIKAVPTEYV